jgi:hypothetical protein
MSAAPNATCRSSRPRAATCLSSWRVRLRLSARRFRFRNSGFFPRRQARSITASERSAGLRLPRPIAACLIVPKALERSAQQGRAGAPNRLASQLVPLTRQRQATAVNHLGRHEHRLELAQLRQDCAHSVPEQSQVVEFQADDVAVLPVLDRKGVSSVRATHVKSQPCAFCHEGPHFAPRSRRRSPSLSMAAANAFRKPSVASRSSASSSSARKS